MRFTRRKRRPATLRETRARMRTAQAETDLLATEVRIKEEAARIRRALRAR
ncbi:hypothetical protein [Actinomadura atramentaria]|uniref:hypothetical protein n=1 Tax=Actinomadura atramentaria TaxID=1990 RepID=UPI00035CDC57|nr:hypothetical protein [Actinomadura atramentaria]